MIKIIINIIMGRVYCSRGVDSSRIGRGIMITISMSKIRKMTASKKNRRENGSRALEEGLNPHSNGDVSSRSLVVVLSGQDRKFRIIGRAGGMMKAINKVVMVSIIIDMLDDEWEWNNNYREK